jgi:thiol-disulfide isomerase/thioredoxin
LEPKLEAVGFVGDYGIGMSSLNSELFKDGEVIIQLYKANTSENRIALIDHNKRNTEREQEIERTLVSMGIPMPIYNETWDIKGRTTNDTETGEIIASSDLTIFQLYSPHCGFCRKAIPIINALHLESNISVIGMTGPESNSDFNKHIIANSINYPFLTYEGDYTESALLRAVGQLGFPTYLVVNRQKKVEGILIGTSALHDWLKYQSIK